MKEVLRMEAELLGDLAGAMVLDLPAEESRELKWAPEDPPEPEDLPPGYTALVAGGRTTKEPDIEECGGLVCPSRPTGCIECLGYKLMTFDRDTLESRSVVDPGNLSFESTDGKERMEQAIEMLQNLFRKTGDCIEPLGPTAAAKKLLSEHCRIPPKSLDIYLNEMRRLEGKPNLESVATGNTDKNQRHGAKHRRGGTGRVEEPPSKRLEMAALCGKVQYENNGSDDTVGEEVDNKTFGGSGPYNPKSSQPPSAHALSALAQMISVQPATPAIASGPPETEADYEDEDGEETGYEYQSEGEEDSPVLVLGVEVESKPTRAGTIAIEDTAFKPTRRHSRAVPTKFVGTGDQVPSKQHLSPSRANSSAPATGKLDMHDFLTSTSATTHRPLVHIPKLVPTARSPVESTPSASPAGRKPERTLYRQPISGNVRQPSSTLPQRSTSVQFGRTPRGQTCQLCRKSKAACDVSRPCSRCCRLGRECIDVSNTKPSEKEPALSPTQRLRQSNQARIDLGRRPLAVVAAAPGSRQVKQALAAPIDDATKQKTCQLSAAVAYVLKREDSRSAQAGYPMQPLPAAGARPRTGTTAQLRESAGTALVSRADPRVTTVSLKLGKAGPLAGAISGLSDQRSVVGANMSNRAASSRSWACEICARVKAACQVGEGESCSRCFRLGLECRWPHSVRSIATPSCNPCKKAKRKCTRNQVGYSCDRCTKRCIDCAG